MGAKILCILLLTSLLLGGCRKDSKDSKESLERQGYQITKKMTAVLKSINDNNSAEKAISKLNSLANQLNENRQKLAKLYNGDIDISTEYGIQTHLHQMREQFPILGKLHDKGISPELLDEIFNAMTSGGYDKAKKIMENHKER